MADLSPAAQAVLIAFGTHPLRADHTAQDLVPALAAALRAAALYCKRDRLQLLAIAAELQD